VAFNDYDDDGRPDIFVANDGMEQFLWHNNGDGTFTNRAIEAGVALRTTAKPIPVWGSISRTTTMTAGPICRSRTCHAGVRSIITKRAVPVCQSFRRPPELSVRRVQDGVSGGAISTTTDGRETCLWRRVVMDNIDRIDPGLRYKEVPLLAKNARKAGADRDRRNGRSSGARRCIR
jgi:hypothetical protein